MSPLRFRGATVASGYVGGISWSWIDRRLEHPEHAIDGLVTQSLPDFNLNSTAQTFTVAFTLSLVADGALQALSTPNRS